MPKKSTLNLISFILVTLFLILSMFLVTVGIGAYRSVRAKADMADESRMSLGYIANKLRSYDAEGLISIEDRSGVTALVLTREDLEDYETLIYFYDGALYELFRDREYEFEPEFGESLMELSALRFEQRPDGAIVFLATLTDGREVSVTVALLSGREVGR